MLSDKKSKIIVILGPTSSGKSDAAIRFAKKLNGEIISADSRQIYKGLDIGTGKISRKEQKIIKHWMLDIASPRTIFSAAQFKKKTKKIITDILKRGKLPIICGGTGFWIKAIVDNVNFPGVKPNKKLRKVLEKYSAEKLFLMLEKLDPARAKNIDRFNKVRLIRAVEIAKALGFVPIYKMQNTKYKFLQIGIKLDKEKLYANIKKHLQKRFKQGMIEEVAKLKKSGLSWKKIQSFGLGYFWISLYLQNLEKFQNFRKEKIPTKNCYSKKSLVNNIIKIPETKKELFEKVLQAEKDYAKRQMTWFQKDKRIKWLKNYKEIKKEAKDFLNK